MSNIEKQSAHISSTQQQPYNNWEGGLRIVVGFVALFLCTVIYWICHDNLGLNLPQLDTETDRLLYGIKLQLTPLIILTGTICFVIAHRAVHVPARNPLSGHEFYVEKPVRILNNTLEQTVLFVLNSIICAVTIKQKFTYWLPFVVFCFAVGRVTFAVGYLIHPRERIFGFVWTFAVNCVLLAFNAMHLVAGFDVLEFVDNYL